MSAPALGMIVVGIDGRSGGEDAASLARSLAEPGSTVALVHVVTGEHASERGRRRLQVAREHFGGPCLTLLRAAASVASGLESATRELGADALVVGTPAARPIGEPQPDLPAILHRSQCVVAVAPPGEAQRTRPLRRIGVAYRNTPSGRSALQVARAIATAHDGEVHAMTVVPVLPSPWRGPTVAGAEGAALLGGEAARAAREHLANLSGVHGIVAEGDPAAQLTRFSRTVDLLVVGLHHHGALLRLLVGSTAEVLLTSSSCPVLVACGGAVGAPPLEHGGAHEPIGLTTS